MHQLTLTRTRTALVGRRAPRPVRPAKPALASVLAAEHVPGQLTLFPRGRGKRPRPSRPPTGVVLRPRALAVIDAVDTYAAAHGWPDPLRARARQTLAEAVDPEPDGAPLTVAHLRACGGPAQLLADVLTELGVLTVPAADPLPDLIHRCTTGLPAGMRRDLADWVATLRDGDRRTRAKSWKTVTEYATRVRPILLEWADHHDSPREITADDVRRVLAAIPLDSCRRNAFSALRSFFTFLRRSGRIFNNPMSNIHLGANVLPPVLPLSRQDYQRLTTHAVTELQRVVLVLAAVHAARPHTMRHLQLTDLNLAQRVLTLAGVRRELDPFSLQVFTDWLTYRRNTWPLTANPHLLVNVCSALHDRPIGATSLNVLFRGTGISLDRIRMDRHLEEALSYGPDPLHLTAVFGISESTGVRYTTNARQLLRPPPPG